MTLPLFEDEEPRGRQSPPPADDGRLSAEGLSEYLAIHPDLKGIGPAKAKTLSRLFGSDFAQALKFQKPEMAKAAGVELAVIERLGQLWLSEGPKRNATRMWLASLGLTYSQVASIEAKYREGARAVLEKNPYLLAREVKGFGFARADAVAKLTGIDPGSEPRIEACSEFVVRRCHEEGHTWISYAQLQSEAIKLLENYDAHERIEACVNRLVYEGKLTGTWITPETWAISTPRIFRQERECAFVLRTLGKAPNRFRREFLQVGAGPREIDLTDRQRDALTAAMNWRVVIVTGGAGTGKTFTMAAIARRYQRAGLKIELAAPTGKAAKRMGEMGLQDVTPQTLHRLLGYNGREFGQKRGQGSAKKSESRTETEQEAQDAAAAAESPAPAESPFVDADVLLIDEASMIDVALMHELLRGIDTQRTSLVLFGDPNQLPSVGAGNVLRDLIERDVVPSVKLQVVMRQAGVLKAASMGILEGKISGSAKEEIRSTYQDPTTGEIHSDYPKTIWPWVVLRKNGDRSTADAVEKLFTEDLKTKLGVEAQDVQVLSPSYKGDAGVDALNIRLQRRTQESLGVTVPENRNHRTRPMAGDRVIQTKNNYELGDVGVMNGTVGVLLSEGTGRWKLRTDDEDILYDGGQLKQLDLAYALTVHKAQGSEFPVVIVVVSRAHAFMLHRNLLYTAVTRAQKMVVLIGEEQAMVNAARKTVLEKRRTFLGTIKEREDYRPRWFEVVG